MKTIVSPTLAVADFSPGETITGGSTLVDELGVLETEALPLEEFFEAEALGEAAVGREELEEATGLAVPEQPATPANITDIPAMVRN